ncbi:MAG: exonuclease domain-containing protein [Sphingomonadales bacterium]
MYAIVDIETTGSFAAANGITEIAIHLFDGTAVTETYETLVNPGQPIPPFIQRMTGISDQMVSSAPSFKEIAEKVFTLLQGQIFVAHNVQFDYSFIKAHLKQEGYQLHCSKLCTVRLSRQILPGLPSYSLGKLCRSIGIPLENRHRAGGDSAATALLFKRLMDADQHHHIARSLKRNSKESILPPHVPREHWEQLPPRPGVYYFHNAKGKVIYVGKAINIRYRVNSHFSNDAPSLQKQRWVNYVHGISHTECATPLMASLLESAEIKHRWPRFNAAQKKQEDQFGLHVYEDQRGYLRLIIDKNRKTLPLLQRFYLLVDAQARLRKLMREFNLCPTLCFFQDSSQPCEGIKEGYCKGACVKKESVDLYNERVQAACHQLQAEPSYAIIDRGLQKNTYSCILVERGLFFGMGYVPNKVAPTHLQTLKEFVTRYRDNSYIQRTIREHADQYPQKVVTLNVAK